MVAVCGSRMLCRFLVVLSVLWIGCGLVLWRELMVLVLLLLMVLGGFVLLLVLMSRVLVRPFVVR